MEVPHQAANLTAKLAALATTETEQIAKRLREDGAEVTSLRWNIILSEIEMTVLRAAKIALSEE